MTAEVRIRRCTLTIGRRDGWSWGAGPEPHIVAALAGIEAAVEAAVVEAGAPAGLDAVLAGTVRLELASDGAPTAASHAALVERLRATAFVGSNGATPPAAGAPTARDKDVAADAGGEGPGGGLPADLAVRGDGEDEQSTGEPARAGGRAPALDRAGGASERSGATDGERAVDGRDGATRDERAGSDDIAPEHIAAAIARTLGRWSRTGHAARFVQAWPDELALAWIGAIAAVAGRLAPDDVATAAMTAEAVDRIAGAILGEDEAAADAAPQRLLVLLAALASALGDRLPDHATQAIARRRVTSRSETEPASAFVIPAGDGPGQAPAPTALVGDDARRRARPVGFVVPALPFLVLAQLSRIGYVDAIVAAAATAGLPPGAVGAAVAGKSLPAPRGDRDSVHLAAMALAAGTSEAELPRALELITECEPQLLAPLAAALQGAYSEGRSANDELLVWRGVEGIVCGEEEGLLPAAWVVTDAELDVVLASLGRPPIRRDDDELGAVARALQDRRTLPGARALEQHFGAAAGTALGMIALNLWRSAARATPLLALERLADLEALVRPEPDGLLVSIPRGQRWLDLQRAGMLELFAIPWLPGGLLEIGTW